MIRSTAVVSLAFALPAGAAETLAVLSVAGPPGPSAELGEMTHQLRAACRDLTAGVFEAAELRSRLLGERSNVSLIELERAYGGALATYQNGEYEGSIRTLRAIVEDLEALPESVEVYAQWIRALLRLAHAEATLGHTVRARAAMERVVALEPKYRPDPEQYSPTYRQEFEAARARVAERPRRSLTVTSLGRSGAVYVDGRPSGTTPATITLPAGRYRIGGSAGALRVPSAWVDLRTEDRGAVLDFSLAEALRANAGPGLALAGPARAAGVIRAGAWLGVDKVLAASVLADGEVQFLVGSLYDIRRGALMREGRVRMTAGAVPSPSLGALATFLLTGQQSSVVESSAPESLPAPQPIPQSAASTAPVQVDTQARKAPADSPVTSPAPAATSASPPTRLGITPRPWMRPAAYATGTAAVLLAGFATYEGISAAGSYREARDMVRSDGTFAPGAGPAPYQAKVESGDSATRRAYLAAGGAVLMAAVTGVLWYVTGEPQAAPAVRF